MSQIVNRNIELSCSTLVLHTQILHHLLYKYVQLLVIQSIDMTKLRKKLLFLTTNILSWIEICFCHLLKNDIIFLNILKTVQNIVTIFIFAHNDDLCIFSDHTDFCNIVIFCFKMNYLWGFIFMEYLLSWRQKYF
jgi:hypothetical protein